MSITERIENDYKQALKQKEAMAISTLRMVKAALHNKEIENKGQALDDAQVYKVVLKQVHQHEESIQLFAKGKRQDLVEKETKELEILKRYLPEQISAPEVAKVVQRIITETVASGTSDFGKVMKAAMAEFKGKADGKLVGQIVSAQLNPSSDKKER